VAAILKNFQGGEQLGLSPFIRLMQLVTDAVARHDGSLLSLF
jgi:hypothetical protein